ncbi:Peptidyl-prolyl cis-trans isomerase FKBP-type N-terminal protein [Dioscorea alata]|uniref:Peptidyl-prolyl cis-trans isomerase FKBP-type N-terminal protein n=1 Tax=Dioscorea alata TaxID=55571 RepID=A0ACB7VCM5_DIOAL|nr:Peptidyl-prolyl cis-trans isomerase FKBP-type N-terminal protein [Dioscorea alata]
MESRYLGDGKGRVLREEGRAAENVYIQKMERERMEKMKQKAEKERTAGEKATASEKKPEGLQQG